MVKRSLAAVVGAAALSVNVAAAGAQSGIEPVDCAGPAPAAEPGTPAWYQRELDNAYCATQRELDAHSNPLYTAAQANRPANRATTAMDPMREPTLLAGTRFRFDEFTFTSAEGKSYPAMLFRPLASSENRRIRAS